MVLALFSHCLLLFSVECILYRVHKIHVQEQPVTYELRRITKRMASIFRRTVILIRNEE